MSKSGDNVSISTLVITLSIHPIHFVAEIIDINAEIKVSVFVLLYTVPVFFVTQLHTLKNDRQEIVDCVVQGCHCFSVALLSIMKRNNAVYETALNQISFADLTSFAICPDPRVCFISLYKI